MEIWTNLLSLLNVGISLLSGLLLALSLLQEGLRDEHLVLGRRGSVFCISMVRRIMLCRRVGTAAMVRHSRSGDWQTRRDSFNQ